MELQNKLDNAVTLIEQLNKENEELKQRAVNAELELSLYKKNYDESMENVKLLIEKCGRAAAEYHESLDSVKKARKEYEAAIKEIYILKKKYKKKINKIIDEIN